MRRIVSFGVRSAIVVLSLIVVGGLVLILRPDIPLKYGIDRLASAGELVIKYKIEAVKGRAVVLSEVSVSNPSKSWELRQGDLELHYDLNTLSRREIGLVLPSGDLCLQNTCLPVVADAMTKGGTISGKFLLGREIRGAVRSESGGTEIDFEIAKTPLVRIVELLTSAGVTLPKQLNLKGGLFSGSGKIVWRGQKPEGSFRADLQDISGEFGKVPFSEFSVPVELDAGGLLLGNSSVLRNRARAQVREVGGPVPITNASFQLSRLNFLPGFGVEITGATGHALGGELSIPRMVIRRMEKSQSCPAGCSAYEGGVALGNVDLARLTESLADKGISGEGRIDLSANFSSDGTALRVADGAFRSVAGGLLRFEQAYLEQMLTDSGVSPALLRVIRFETLTGEFSMDGTGQMLISAKIAGHSAVDSSQPVNLNLNVEQKLGPLLESVGLVRAIEAGDYSSFGRE